MRLITLALGAALIATAAPAQAKHHHKAAEAGDGLAGATLLLVRHAEKPESGQGLTPAGEARAKAYASYFRHFDVDGKPVRIDAVVATSDTPKSARPRLTVEPIAQALGLPVQQPFADEDVKGLADWLHAGAPRRTVLIAWHHGKLPKLLDELKAGCDGVVPDKWPAEVYDWVVVVRYGKDGASKSCKRVEEPNPLS